MTRLDTRKLLYGERRLTDPQVRALRAMRDAGGELNRARAGYPAHAASFTIPPRTMDALAEAGLVVTLTLRGCCGTALLTDSGREILARIDAVAAPCAAAPAPSLARSG